MSMKNRRKCHESGYSTSQIYANAQIMIQNVNYYRMKENETKTGIELIVQYKKTISILPSASEARKVRSTLDPTGAKPKTSAKRRTTRPPAISLHQASLNFDLLDDRSHDDNDDSSPLGHFTAQSRCGTSTPRKRCQSPRMVSIWKDHPAFSCSEWKFGRISRRADLFPGLACRPHGGVLLRR